MAVFGVVGGLAGLLWMGIAYFVGSAGVRPWLAAALAFLCCVPLAYLGHRRFTFGSGALVKGEFPKFVFKTVVGFSIATITPEMVVRFGGSLMLALLVTPVVVACVTYPVARFWVFVSK
jgi:putative flippase GtrA